MSFVFDSDLSLDIPSQFRQRRSKDQEPGPTCTLRGKFLHVKGKNWLNFLGCVYIIFKMHGNEINEDSLYFSDCLRSFTDLEELDETELYYCHKCKKRQKSTKKFWIQKLPKVRRRHFYCILIFIAFY